MSQSIRRKQLLKKLSYEEESNQQILQLITQIFDQSAHSDDQQRTSYSNTPSSAVGRQLIFFEYHMINLEINRHCICLSIRLFTKF